MLSGLPPDQIVPALPRGVWFSAVGGPLQDVELAHCTNYLKLMKLTALDIAPVNSWVDASALSASTQKLRAWWERERREERRLFDIAASSFSADAILMRLSNLMEGSAELFHGPAAVACRRAGVEDPAVARSAAGAASHCLHQYGLTQLAQQSDEHFFAVKFQLFLAGRWPLCAGENRFFIF